MESQDYLVSHGLVGDIGRYRPDAPLALGRGERVLVQTVRGLELGRVLRAAPPRSQHLPETAVGPLLRRIGAEDEAIAQRQADRANALLRRGAELLLALDLPAALLDAEVLYDGRAATLLHVRWGAGDLRDLVRVLSRETELSITLADVGETPHGCGSSGDGGCGSCGDGGCGDGGCGSGCGEVSAAEVQAHFAELRTQMERNRYPISAERR